MTQGKIYINDTHITKAYIGNESLKQIYLDGISYLGTSIVEFNPDDLLITFNIDTGIIKEYIDEIKDIAYDIGLYGEKHILLWNSVFSEVEDYFNSNFNNINFYQGNTKLRFLYVNVLDKRFFILEIPYFSIDEVVNITAVIYEDKTRQVNYNPLSITRNYYDLNEGLPGEYILDTEKSLALVDGRYVLSMTWDEYGALPVADVEYRDILSIEQTVNDESYKSFIQVDNDPFIIPEGEPSFSYLQTLIILAQNLNDELFTNESFEALEIIISQVSSLTEEAKIEEIESAINSIKEAIENLEKIPQPEYSKLTIGTGSNKTGLFIIPKPDHDININLNVNEQYLQEEYEFLLSRLKMHLEGKHITYQPNYYSNPSNKAIKKDYDYLSGNYLNYTGFYYIALLIIMQNIIQVGYKKTIVDGNYEITYPNLFEHYDLTGLTSCEIYPIDGTPTLVDVQQTSGWWRTIGHTSKNPTYRCLIRTYSCPYWDTRSVGWGCFSSTSGNFYHCFLASPCSGSRPYYCEMFETYLAARTCEEWGTCGGETITVTSAAFTAPIFPIKSNTAELIIENGSLATTSVLRTSTNTNIGTVTVTGNKYITLNNRGNGSYRLHLTTSTYNANWFTNLFVKNTYNNINLMDVSYEIKMIVKHGLSQSEVNTLINNDNNNRNIYRRTINITNFQWTDKRLKKLLRHDDYQNIVFVLKNEKILLNHRIDNGKIMIELPNKYLTKDENIIELLIMPLDYKHESIEIDQSLSNMPLIDVEYAFPGDTL